jgi:hypothetical protein
MISSSQGPLPDNTQHSQQINIHAPGGIWTHDLSRQAAADLRLRPRGYWDRQTSGYYNPKISLSGASIWNLNPIITGGLNKHVKACLLIGRVVLHSPKHAVTSHVPSLCQIYSSPSSKHPGLGHLARSVSRVKVALSNVSLVSQLFSFRVGCNCIILKGFGFVAFFAGVKATSFCIHLSCLVCSLSVVRGEWSHLFCSHKGRNLPEVSIA